MTPGIKPEDIEVLHYESLVLVSTRITPVLPFLFAEEAESIKGAVEKRRREFACGRALARHGMEIFGILPQAIPVGAMRQPLWPENLAGSITHTNTHCTVALGRRQDYMSIGIDMETVGGLTKELWGHIFCQEERDYLDSLPSFDQQQMSCLMFSAKEAYYKMQFPLTGILEGFTSVTTHKDHSGSLWVAPCEDLSSPLRSRFRAHLLSCSGESCVLVYCR